MCYLAWEESRKFLKVFLWLEEYNKENDRRLFLLQANEYTWKKNENSSGVQILKTQVYVS